MEIYAVSERRSQMFAFLIEHCLLLALHLEDQSLFPPPLGAKEEKKQIEQMLNGSVEARNRLIEHNLRLVAHITKKYYSEQADNDELISIGTLGLIKAISTYRPEKGTRLATYAARCIENEILMYFRARKKCAHDVSFEEPLEQDAQGNALTLMDLIFEEDMMLEELDKRQKLWELKRFLREMPDGRDKEILYLRYGLSGEEPLTQHEIASRYGISRSYVSRIETKCLKKLRKKFDEE